MSKLSTSVRRLMLALVGISIVGVALALSAGLSTVQAGAGAKPKEPLGACTTYSYTTSQQATVVPGTTDTGNHCNDASATSRCRSRSASMARAIATATLARTVTCN